MWAWQQVWQWQSRTKLFDSFRVWTHQIWQQMWPIWQQKATWLYPRRPPYWLCHPHCFLVLFSSSIFRYEASIRENVFWLLNQFVYLWLAPKLKYETSPISFRSRFDIHIVQIILTAATGSLLLIASVNICQKDLLQIFDKKVIPISFEDIFL